MIIGPFNEFDIEAIHDLLEAKEIQFEVKVHQNLLEKAHQTSGTRRSVADIKAVHFEISDEDFKKIEADLERYGIVAPSDGSYELGEEDE